MIDASQVDGMLRQNDDKTKLIHATYTDTIRGLRLMACDENMAGDRPYPSWRQPWARIKATAAEFLTMPKPCPGCVAAISPVSETGE